MSANQNRESREAPGDTGAPVAPLRNRPRRGTRWKVWIASGLLVLAALIVVLGKKVRPYVSQRMLALLSEKFQGDVQVGNLEVDLGFPLISVRAEDVTVRHQGRTDVPALISVRELRFGASLWSLIEKTHKVSYVELVGLVVRIPPRGAPQAPQAPGNVSKQSWSRVKDIPILIGKIEADDARIELISSKPGKLSRVFEVHRVVLERVGLHRAAAFHAQLTNARPPGEIDSEGRFGPWDAEDPGQTPLAATYTFANADLGVFKGIGGTLSSRGKYQGVLSKIEVEGETDTPDFALTRSGTPVALHTSFSATVDGTNGNTLLHPVRAHFLNSNVTAQGDVVRLPSGRGHEVKLSVVVDDARLEDLLRLAVKAEKPFMTGAIRFHSAFDLPPGEGDVIERLQLAGNFGIDKGEFTNPDLGRKVQDLSRRGQGKPEDKDSGSDVSTLSGAFALSGGQLNLQRLSFAVTGAEVRLDGSYGIEKGILDFHGKLRLDAKLSQTMTGYKSVLLRPFNGFFRKQNVTEIPIRIGGTREHPTFGLDFHHSAGAQDHSARR